MIYPSPDEFAANDSLQLGGNYDSLSGSDIPSMGGGWVPAPSNSSINGVASNDPQYQDLLNGTGSYAPIMPQAQSPMPESMLPSPLTQNDAYAQHYNQIYGGNGDQTTLSPILRNYDIQSPDQDKTSQQLLAEESMRRGGQFKNPADATNYIEQLARQHVLAKGLDLRSPQGQQMYQSEISNGTSYAAQHGYIPDPKDAKNGWLKTGDNNWVNVENGDSIVNGVLKKNGAPPIPSPGITDNKPLDQKSVLDTQNQQDLKTIADPNASSKQKAEANKRVQAYQKINAPNAILSKEGIEREVDGILAGKPMTSFGMGKDASANRTAVQNRLAEKANELGSSPQDQMLAQAAYKANTQELTKLQVQRGPIMSYERNALKALDLAEKLSEKVDRSGVPVIDRWIQSGKKSIAGDPDVAAFHAQAMLAANEFAKLTSSTTGAGVTSDAAQKHSNELLDPAFTKLEFKAVADSMRKDMQFRREGYDEQIDATKNLISTIAPKAGGTNAPQGASNEPPYKAPAGKQWLRNKKTGEFKLSDK